MKWGLYIFFLIFTVDCFSQFKNYNKDNPDSLAAAIVKSVTRFDTTERQKVFSIFKWITTNIEYNVGGKFGTNAPIYISDWNKEYWEDDTANAIPSLDKRVAAIVLKKRVAVCDGYARLFKILCTVAGIKAEVISGFGKANGNEKHFTTNHRWNAVFIDTSWFLLDATWAAGFINSDNQFQRNFNPYYFLTPPEKFISHHYPENQKWTLMPVIPMVIEFKNGPYLFPVFQKYAISKFYPSTGIINARVGDSIVFQLETKFPNKTLWVSDFKYLDSSGIIVLQCCGIKKPINRVNGNTVSFVYQVKHSDSEWLQVVYDDEILMRYRINILPSMENYEDEIP